MRPQAWAAVGFMRMAPASMRSAAIPSFRACFITFMLAGKTSRRVPGATPRPFSTVAASRKSWMRPLVQVPITT